MNDINSSFGKGSVTRLGSAGGALVYVLSSLLAFYMKIVFLFFRGHADYSSFTAERLSRVGV